MLEGRDCWLASKLPDGRISKGWLLDPGEVWGLYDDEGTRAAFVRRAPLPPSAATAGSLLSARGRLVFRGGMVSKWSARVCVSV